MQYSSNEKRKIWIVFHDMIADMLSNKKLNPIVTQLFVKGRKLSLVFNFTQFFFAVPKELGYILHMILLQKFQKNRASANFN